nr:G161 [uncultured bacterium]ART38967.1 H311 [uncultured bacterium]
MVHQHMIPFSILDLAPVPVGSDTGQALRNTVALAQHAERWGFNRYWLAEHHGMAGIASAATAVVIGQVAAATTRIRVGAGGIMLPNHAPLVIAEQFGTLATLFPGRIDLGLGRAPGTDQITARALRRNLAASAEEFPQDVMELMAYLGPPDPAQPVRAIPGEGTQVPVWILGSSLFGAQLAAALGLPFAFASHFAPGQMQQAVDVYRRQFRPSQQLQSPYVMVGYNVFAADTDEQAQLLASSMQQAFVALRSGRPGKLPPPVPGYLDSLSPMERSMLEQVLSCSAIGAPDTVQARMASFIEQVQPDELIITSQMFDHTARLHSYEIVAAVQAALGT